MFIDGARRNVMLLRRVRDSDVRFIYLDIAARWRRMAAQQEEIDRTLSARSQSAE